MVERIEISDQSHEAEPEAEPNPTNQNEGPIGLPGFNGYLTDDAESLLQNDFEYRNS